MYDFDDKGSYSENKHVQWELKQQGEENNYNRVYVEGLYSSAEKFNYKYRTPKETIKFLKKYIMVDDLGNILTKRSLTASRILCVTDRKILCAWDFSFEEIELIWQNMELRLEGKIEESTVEKEQVKENNQVSECKVMEKEIITMDVERVVETDELNNELDNLEESILVIDES